MNKLALLSTVSSVVGLVGGSLSLYLYLDAKKELNSIKKNSNNSIDSLRLIKNRLDELNQGNQEINVKLGILEKEIDSSSNRFESMEDDIGDIKSIADDLDYLDGLSPKELDERLKYIKETNSDIMDTVLYLRDKIKELNDSELEVN